MHSADSRRMAAALESRVGQGHDQAHIAASVVALWREIDRQLLPIIGARGVAALYGRTLYLTSRAHPWLGDVPERVQSSMDLGSLYSSIVAQPRAIGIDGGRVLFTTFHGLLESMVGAVLTERLLRDVVAPTSSGEPAQDMQ